MENDNNEATAAVNPSNKSMCQEVTEQLIRRMGITGKRIRGLDNCMNANEKDRFWTEVLEELAQYGDVGTGTVRAIKERWQSLCGRFKQAKKKAEKSGEGAVKFEYYELMKSEVGMRPRFTASSLVDTAKGGKS
jgi:hypothetical protein